MVAVRSVPPGEIAARADQRIVLHGVPWSHYEIMLAIRGDASVPRMAYLEGELELMSPSRDHEMIKSRIGRLIETYALDAGIEINAYGSWTLKNAPRERGVEPDECYVIGPNQTADRPHLAVEVRWTHGGLDKLDIYRGLEVREVWFWENGRIDIFVLEDGQYTPAQKSALLPELDLALLASFVDMPTLNRAVQGFRAALTPILVG